MILLGNKVKAHLCKLLNFNHPLLSTLNIVLEIMFILLNYYIEDLIIFRTTSALFCLIVSVLFIIRCIQMTNSND